MSTRELEAQKLQKDWSENPRWRGLKRGYSAADVVRLRGSLQPEHTLAARAQLPPALSAARVSQGRRPGHDLVDAPAIEIYHLEAPS